MGSDNNCCCSHVCALSGDHLLLDLHHEIITQLKERVVKVKFVINGETLDDIEMPQHPLKGHFVTYGGKTTEVKEIEYVLERKGFFVRVIVRCVCMKEERTR